MDDKQLDMLIDSLRDDVSEPSAELYGRILADAYELQPEADLPPTVQAKRRSAFKHVLAVFGGWGGLSGLACAASVGFVLGFNPPALVQNSFGLVLLEDASEFDDSLSGFGWDFEEG